MNTSPKVSTLSTQNSEYKIEANKVGYKLTSTELNRLSGREATEKAEQDKRSELPSHIQKMVEQLEKLKELLEQAKKQLEKLKAQTNQDDETLKAQIELQHQMVAQLQMQMMTLSKEIGEAMKEADISDPGVLLSVLI
ncbi:MULTISPECIES: hypothetical protein [Pseudoalteromonas]|uniref:Uncharacterized protein n=1 Tax=Pseudoalteromonas piscicida TaxID=43662 RepID=A0ABM6NKF1_PSEO7|nr:MULTISPECIES: hypothetical protein [Pseudoalteromonas]ATD09456.1 hypothetical protein PPIS_b0265 [Pseudoalteromonas piscicida]MCO7200496.1 hypothetical protein [Pseudoalteromonas sp. OANN1]WPU31389.1 hypothetical protein SIO17_20425 [Pseudoalteromonas piscicida]